MESSLSSPTLRSLRLMYLPQLQVIYDDREAERLLDEWAAFVLNRPRHQLSLIRTDILEDDLVMKLLAGYERLADGEPLQYLTGYQYFHGLRIAVSPAVLIPRPETEELVDLALSYLTDNQAPTILDACTGSGCVALALKAAKPKAVVSALDVSPEAIEVAQHNGNQLNIDVNWQLADLSESPKIWGPHSLDAIVSNPPYVPLDELESLSPNVRNHEPHLALFAPADDPLFFFNILAQMALHCLRPGGFLLMEGHVDYVQDFTSRTQAAGNFLDVQTITDSSGRPRFIFARTYC